MDKNVIKGTEIESFCLSFVVFLSWPVIVFDICYVMSLDKEVFAGQVRTLTGVCIPCLATQLAHGPPTARFPLLPAAEPICHSQDGSEKLSQVSALLTGLLPQPKADR